MASDQRLSSPRVAGCLASTSFGISRRIKDSGSYQNFFKVRVVFRGVNLASEFLDESYLFLFV